MRGVANTGLDYNFYWKLTSDISYLLANILQIKQLECTATTGLTSVNVL